MEGYSLRTEPLMNQILYKLTMMHGFDQREYYIQYQLLDRYCFYIRSCSWAVQYVTVKSLRNSIPLSLVLLSLVKISFFILSVGMLPISVGTAGQNKLHFLVTPGYPGLGIGRS